MVDSLEVSTDIDDSRVTFEEKNNTETYKSNSVVDK